MLYLPSTSVMEPKPGLFLMVTETPIRGSPNSSVTRPVISMFAPFELWEYALAAKPRSTSSTDNIFFILKRVYSILIYLMA